MVHNKSASIREAFFRKRADHKLLHGHLLQGQQFSADAVQLYGNYWLPFCRVGAVVWALEGTVRLVQAGFVGVFLPGAKSKSFSLSNPAAFMEATLNNIVTIRADMFFVFMACVVFGS
jgi:hypothetical protein